MSNAQGKFDISVYHSLNIISILWFPHPCVFQRS